MSRHKGHCSRTAHKSEDIASKEPSTLRQDNDNMEDEEVFEDEQRPGPSNESQVDNQDDCGACNSPYSPVFRQNYQWIYCTQYGTPLHMECSTVQFKATDYDNIHILALPNYTVTLLDKEHREDIGNIVIFMSVYVICVWYYC